MNTTTKQNRIKNWLEKHPKVLQWLWFIGLWIAGIATVYAMTYPLKLLMKNL